ncbi:hypothetical protein SCHIN_v1c04140 [Spiroplasma chinense]|uniref:MtN3 and saliva related transmembrane protein n=1 Tax=Spiroplasma chinense TaxID=216932 RepID=A0A5B9Y3M0_9MOLU|nr:PQ-loop domain-containing transporter [Spiroplasma chinense]QEH61611.1 hypothetical protein SCHIN_v1c04140 [Spiroplasma chinense]
MQVTPIEIVGYIATAFSCIRLIPQCIKIIKTRSVNDISLIMYILWVISAILWIVASSKPFNYNIQLLITNCVAGTTALVILIFKIIAIVRSKKDKNIKIFDDTELLRRRYVRQLQKNK